ncbi:SpdD protein [Streptomyces triticiradicis]|uniref:SpdD protein n=1 Tax=Streptomyces triticiradicis TaxID=2651189 RepID=A0A7J5D9I6_9ACTN|nr:SpdD protein [Streptomyces triticiradicis]KAB1984605.1 SpdD protein [Streptomyces triticiradicis]
MLLRPKMPDAAPLPIAQTPARPAEHHHAPASCSCAHAPMAPAGRPVSPLVGRGVSAVAAVLVVGVVLTALLATVAITAVSVSIAALVLRSLLNSAPKR